MQRVTGESDVRAEQIRAEHRSYRNYIEVQLRSTVRDISDLLSREETPDWDVVRLLLSNALGKASEIVANDKRDKQAGS